MDTMAMGFKDILDGFFYPSDDKKKKKKNTHVAETGYVYSEADGDSISLLRDKQVCSLYDGSDYPAMMISWYDDADAERVIAALSAIFPQRPITATEPFDDRLSALYAFRADSYFSYAPSASAPSTTAPDATRPPKLSRTAPGQSSVTPIARRPMIFVRKTSLKAIEEYLAGNVDFTSPLAILTAADARPAMPAAMGVEHPAEFIVARLFMPPRLTVAQLYFAVVPMAVAPAISDPSDSLRFCFDASWSFAGQPLSVRYHLDLPAVLGSRADALARAVASGMFKDALSFWGNWKKPIENPSIAPCPDLATSAAPRPGAAFLLAEIRGEGMRFSCAVEFPQKMIALILKMANCAPLGSDALAGGGQPDSHWAIELFRANDRLFIMLKAGYRKPFLANPAGPIPFDGPTLFGLFSLMDDADRAVIIQNFLVPRYELANLPLFFFYHEVRPGQNGEAEYRLKPAFPLARADIERYLSETQREEWLYHLGKGCADRRTNPEEFAKANRDATVELARAGSSGKLLLSRKALALLREEVLAPIDAADALKLADTSSVADTVDAVKSLPPKALADLLMKIDTQTLAIACLVISGLDAIVMRGLSQGRQGDLRTEVEVMKRRQKRAELSSGALLEARERFAALAADYDDMLEDPLV